ncbi:TRAP transporter substrate-binding protein [Cetobacterium sp.]|uniref:TRAP transporter substrate-binding protein n=1 Tax=Cetobacterium sp. TaxID=2071632 RepID=UPI003EE6B7AC
MKKIILGLGIIGIIFTGCSDDKKQENLSNGNVVLKLGHVNGDKTNYHYGMLKYAEEVERLTDGKVKVEVYANAQLGNERDMVEGLQLGTIDIAAVASPVLASFVPEMSVLDAPFMFKSYEHADNVIDGKVGEVLSEKLKKQEFNTVAWMYSGFRNVFSIKPLTDIDSFKGLKIRTMENKMHIKTFEALGALATPMPYGEVFTGLQQGTIDAAENATDNVLTQKFYEVTKNVGETGHFFTYIALGVSDKALAKIPADLVPKLYEAGTTSALYQRNLLIESNANAKTELQKLGVTFTEPNKEELVLKVKPIYQEFKDVIPEDLVAEIKKLEK